MAYSIILLPLVILAILLCISLPIFLGVFVYQDAKARGMEPLMWALIAVLAPSFIGLIIYLVVRRDHVVLNCPNCGGEVQENFVSCPQCRQKLNANCGHCGAALRPEWKLCPQCGTEITETEPFTPPVISQGAGSKKLMAVVVAILLIPVVLVVIAFGGLAIYTPAGSSVTEEVFDDNLVREAFYESTDYTDFAVLAVSETDLGTQAKQWIQACKKGKKGIYAQTYSTEENGNISGTWGSGSYDMTYAYTVVVINDDTVYDDAGAGYLHYGDEDFMITQDIVQTFTEVTGGKDMKHAKQYDNVFVLKYPLNYDIDFTFTVGMEQSMTAELEDESLDIVLESSTMLNGAPVSMTYTVPLEGKYYSPLKQVQVETTVVEK